MRGVLQTSFLTLAVLAGSGARAADAGAMVGGVQARGAQADADILNEQDRVFKISPQGLGSGDHITDPQQAKANADAKNKAPVGNAEANDDTEITADPENTPKIDSGEGKLLEDYDPKRLGVNANGADKAEKKDAVAGSAPKDPTTEHPKKDHVNHDLVKTPADDAQLTTGKGAGTGGVGAKAGSDRPDSKAVFDALDNHSGQKQANASPQVLIPHDEDDEHMSHMGRLLAAASMIVVSELGDKTFFIAALMAMKHPHLFVFSSSFGALAVMTLLSAYIGRIIPSLLSSKVTLFLASILFFVFGVRLLREGLCIDAETAATEELYDVEKEIELQEQGAAQDDAERGAAGSDRGGDKGTATGNRGGAKQRLEGVVNLLSLFLSPAWLQIFFMTFLGEWGDRSQIATVVMGTGAHFWPVVIGGLLGHAACTFLAVSSGKLLAARLSLRTITLCGSFCFLVFAVLYFCDWLIES